MPGLPVIGLTPQEAILLFFSAAFLYAASAFSMIAPTVLNAPKVKFPKKFSISASAKPSVILISSMEFVSPN